MEWLGALAKAVVAAVVAFVSALPGVAPAQPSPGLPPALALTAPAPDPGTPRVLVRFKSTASAAAVDSARRAAGATERLTIARLGVRVLYVPDQAAAIATLRASAIVDYVEPDAILLPTDTLPNDPYFPMGSGSLLGGEWGSFKTAAPKAWDITRGNSAIVVATIDSGVAPGLPDLVGQMVPGYNVLSGTTDTTDTYGHGTYVAGVIAAATDNGVGVAGYCWACRLMPVKVYSSSSGAYVSDIAAGMTWSVDHGARVLNISLAGAGTSTTLANAVTYARQHGAVVVAAAGNSGCNCATYPASTPGVIGVAASDQSDSLYSYSNYGSWVDLAAPGQNLTTWPNGTYAPVGGTSLAAPVIAGIAGLMFSLAPSATPDAVEQALFASVDPVAGTRTVAYGRVNAYKALLALASGTVASATATPTPAPAATPTPAPTPTPTAAPSATPAPTASPTPAPALAATATSTYSGALNQRSSSRNYTFTSGSGLLDARLSFNKQSALTLAVYAPDGTLVMVDTGASILSLRSSLAAGSYTITVSGDPGPFTLTVIAPTP
jgi:hypothetical protein